MSGGEVETVGGFTKKQRDDLAKLLGRLNPSSIRHLGESLIGEGVIKDLGNDIGDPARAAQKVVQELAAREKLAAAIAQLQSDQQRDFGVSRDLSRILQGIPIDAGDGLEAFDGEGEPFLVSEAFEQTLRILRRTVCAIGLEGRDLNRLRGSGILVGPDLVLTNYHVVEPFLRFEQGAYHENAAGDKIHCIFDYGAPPQPKVPPAATASVRAVRAKSTGWLKFVRPLLPGDGTAEMAKYTNQLDCVLIQLAIPIGRLPRRASGGLSRGWLSMAEADATPGEGTKVVLFQHPAEMHQMFDVGEVFRLADADRVWYWLNSARGSSGGAAVNSEGRLIALHNANVEIKTDADVNSHRKLNQGVWIGRIGEAVRNECPGFLNAANADPVPFWSLSEDLDAPEPALGRTTFRDHVASMLEPSGARVLVVTGRKGTGVRFSMRLLRRIVGAQVPIVEFNPAALGMHSPAQFLNALRNGLPCTTPAPKIPEAKGEEDLARWLVTDLTAWLLNVVVVEQAKSKGQFPAWVVINTIDENGNAMSSWANNLRECIAAIIGVRDNDKASFDIPHLRWLFLARPEQILSLGNLVRHEENLDKDDTHSAAFATCVQWAWNSLGEEEVTALPMWEAVGADALDRWPGDPPRQVLARQLKRLIANLLKKRRAERGGE